MPEKDEKEILALLRAQEDAVGRGDAPGVLRPLADEVVTYDLPPPLEQRGNPASAEDGLRQWFATWNGPVTTTLHEPTVLVDGNLAVVFGLSRMQGTKKAGAKVDNWNRRTVALRRIDGAWRIVHVHDSYPMLMDGSGKAATDLSP
jgi:ketosteroid isomerase-like protein